MAEMSETMRQIIEKRAQEVAALEREIEERRKELEEKKSKDWK